MIRSVFNYLYSLLLRLKFGLTFPVAMMLSDIFLLDYKNRYDSLIRTYAVHRKGWSVLDWKCTSDPFLGYARYLSTTAYYSGHPYNGDYSDWIDDFGIRLRGNQGCQDYYY